MARSSAAIASSPPATPAPAFRITVGRLIRSARWSDDRYRSQARLSRALGWPARKLLDMELGRIQPSADDLTALTRELPVLGIVLARLRAERP